MNLSIIVTFLSEEPYYYNRELVQNALVLEEGGNGTDYSGANSTRTK